MDRLQAGIKSVVPLSGALATKRWEDQAIVCTLISEYILKSCQDLNWLNPVAIGSVITESCAKAAEMSCPKAQNIEDIIIELEVEGVCVASWTSQNEKPMSSFISQLSLERYAKMYVYIISVGSDLVVLAANADRIYIVDPHPRNPATGGPPTHSHSKGVLVEISNFFGIGNYLHNYNEGSFDSESAVYIATSLVLEVRPPKVEIKKEVVNSFIGPDPFIENLGASDAMNVKEDEPPRPRPPTPVDDIKQEEDEEEDDKSSKRSAEEMGDDEDDEDEEEDGDETKTKPTVQKKKRVIGISKKRKSVRGKK